MRIFENLNYDFLGKRKFFYGVSGTLFLLGLLFIILRGLQFGIDFKGGSEIVLEFQNTISIGEVRNEIDTLGLGNVEIKTFGGEKGILIRTELQQIPAEIYPKIVNNIENTINQQYADVPRQVIDSSTSSITYSFPNPDTTEAVIDLLNEKGFQAVKVSEEPDNTELSVGVGIADWIKINLREDFKDNPFTVLKEERVGPKIGAELKEDAIIAVVIALIAILIYLGFRFKFIFAAGAVAALFHDVFITLGMFAILYNVIPGLNLEIDLTIVAAFLTLVGYSINDTVIVFDRVRENLKIHKTRPIEEVINQSISQTMSRTIITGLTTLFVISVLLIFGGEVLRAFAFALFFGMIIGTYSSIFVASALVLEYANRSKKKVQF